MITFLSFIAVLLIIYAIVASVFNNKRKAQLAAQQAFDANPPQDRWNQRSRPEVNVPELPGNPWTLLVIGILLLATLITFGTIVKTVGAQEVGVVVTPSGVEEKPLHTGWHLVAPWKTVNMMDKTVWVYTFTDKKKEGSAHDADAIWSPTKDGIKMGLDISVSWRIDPEAAPWIYQNVSESDGDPATNTRYIWIEENIIRAKTKSELALTVSQYTPIEVYSTKREEIQDKVFTRLDKELKAKHLILDQVDIREVFYNKEYEQAINNKKLAEQEALRLVDVTKQKDELLKQAVINKNIAIEQAQGEAEALKIKGSSIATNPKIIELEWINKWNGALPSYMMGSGQGVMINLNKQ